MRTKTVALFASAVTLLAGPVSAIGSVFLYEPFNYDPATVTQLKGQTPDGIRIWNVAGAAQPGFPAIEDASTGLVHPAAGNLTLPDGMPTPVGNLANYGGGGEGVRINVDTSGNTIAQDGTTLFYSLGLRVDSVTHLTSTGAILTCFTQYLNGGTGSQVALGAVLCVRPGSDTNHYQLGMTSHAQLAEVVWTPFDFPIGSTQFIVAADTQTTTGINADDVSRLWLNPASLGGTAPTPDVTTSIHDFNPSATQGDMNFFGSFEFRRQNGSSNYPDVNSVFADELRLGTTYAEVTPYTQTPEPSIAFVVAGIVGLCARRRRSS